MYSLEKIIDKDVFIVDSHQDVLLPWSIIRRRHQKSLNLITLDHHTDTVRAFRNYIFHTVHKNKFDIANDFNEQYQKQVSLLIKTIDWNSDSSINQAISKLNWDEQIDAAILIGVIDFAVAINLSSTSPLKNKIVEVSSICSLNCEKSMHDDTCQLHHYNQVLESNYLERMLEIAEKEIPSTKTNNIDSNPYILDIDLDYFHTEKSINPDDTNKFYSLIRNAQAITIALEENCVQNLKVEGSDVNSDGLLYSIKEHVRKAQQ